LSGLPKELTREDLLEVLDKRGFSGYYDFVFVPTDTTKSCSLGFALVNLTRHAYGLSLAAQLHGFNTWGICTSATPCDVEWSVVQGFAENVQHFHRHCGSGEGASSEGSPLVFSKGLQIPLPSQN